MSDETEESGMIGLEIGSSYSANFISVVLIVE